MKVICTVQEKTILENALNSLSVEQCTNNCSYKMVCKDCFLASYGEESSNDNKTIEFKLVKEKVYISGAITGVDSYLSTFKEVETSLIELGYEVINPAKILALLPSDTPYNTYMEMSYSMLKTCDYIYMMNGWTNSNGAKLELNFARKNKIKVLDIELDM